MDASSFRTNSVSHLWCVVQRFPIAKPAQCQAAMGSWLKELRTGSSRQQRQESDVMENIGKTKLFAGLQQTSS
ncbi:hypothetical protein XocBAI15_15595 [Xanthomonas oryzae pv. oryzicola]|nr:hypothetical protein XocBAI15_15595 [Xanthomonas oryzae pv. oryzicola]OWB32958.1 hypothetical protein XocBAI20_01950 [Xanthomonas oryzae pv. oryzicola]